MKTKVGFGVLAIESLCIAFGFMAYGAPPGIAYPPRDQTRTPVANNGIKEIIMMPATLGAFPNTPFMLSYMKYCIRDFLSHLIELTKIPLFLFRNTDKQKERGFVQHPAMRQTLDKQLATFLKQKRGTTPYAQFAEVGNDSIKSVQDREWSAKPHTEEVAADSGQT
jgi:hypothetical protein